MVWLSADERPLHNRPRTPSLFFHLDGDEDHDEDNGDEDNDKDHNEDIEQDHDEDIEQDHDGGDRFYRLRWEKGRKEDWYREHHCL